MKLPSDPAEIERQIGPRGTTPIRTPNRPMAIKWLIGQGFPGVFCAALSVIEMNNAYNQLDGSGLDALKKKYARAQAIAAENANSVTVETSDTLPATPTPAAEQNAPTVNSVAPATPSHPSNKGQQLLELLGSIGGVDRDAVEAIVERQLSQFRDLLPDFVAACSPVTRIEIVRPDTSVYRVEGITHPQFQKLLKLATSRGPDGYVPGIFISGEASSGKTTGCRMLAEALGLKWYMNGAISQPHEMLGFIDGNGNYHRTPFRDAYEYGGPYTFDEVDRSDAGALLAVNPHLAGNVGSFPDGMVTKHKDFILIGTANTWGHGGDANYSGATKLDAAFLSRFPSRLAWDIDEATEIFISGNETWARRVQGARKRARAAGLKVMIDVRMTLAGAAHIANGMTSDEAAECTYLANLKSEQRAIVEG